MKYLLLLTILQLIFMFGAFYEYKRRALDDLDNTNNDT